MSTLKVSNIQHSSSSNAAIVVSANGDVAVTGNSFTVGGNNISPVQSFRNKIINGNFDYWQRGTSSSTSGYLADRWQILSFGSTFAASRQSFTLGQTDVPNEPTYFHRVVVTSVAGSTNYCGFEQLIESVRTFAGQTATLSFWAKADASKNIAIEFFQYFGSGGSPSSSVTSISVTTCALTTSWQKFTITVNVPSISGKTLGTNNNDYLRIIFWLDSGSAYNSRNNSLGQQSGTFDIAQVQLEAGSVATPFEMRPLGFELALCQRYYQIAKASQRAYTSDGYWGVQFVHKVEMRTTPSIGTPTGGNNSLPGTFQGIIVADTFQTGVQWYGSAGTYYCYGVSLSLSAEL